MNYIACQRALILALSACCGRLRPDNGHQPRRPRCSLMKVSIDHDRSCLFRLCCPNILTDARQGKSHPKRRPSGAELSTKRLASAAKVCCAESELKRKRLDACQLTLRKIRTLAPRETLPVDVMLLSFLFSMFLIFSCGSE